MYGIDRVQAIQIVAPGRLALVELPSRPLRPREVRIAVASACVCGSDLKNIAAPVLVPQVPGHEFSGVVVEVSPETPAALKVGARVTAFPMMVCMQCADCRDNRLRDCAHKLSLGFQLPGAFAEEVIVDSRLVVPLPDTLTYDQGALVEHLCCGHRLAKEFAKHKLAADSHIVIIGDGPIALADVQAGRIAGYRRMTLIGKHRQRMEMARKLGASGIFPASDIDAIVKNRALTPIDACILAAPAEQTLAQLLPLLKSSAVVFPQTRVKNPEILRHMSAAGMVLGRAFAYELADFAEVIGLIENGTLDTTGLITNRIDLLHFAEEFPAIVHKENHCKTAVINHRLEAVIENHRRATS